MTIQTKTQGDEILRRQTLAHLEASRDNIAAICRRYDVARLTIFGSLIRAGAFDDDSDIDLLVEFSPGVRHGLSFFAMEQALEDLLGRQTQLLTAGDLSPYFRADVLENAQEIYRDGC